MIEGTSTSHHVSMTLPCVTCPYGSLSMYSLVSRRQQEVRRKKGRASLKTTWRGGKAGG